MLQKNKHDCFITNKKRETLTPPFTISNNLSGFTLLYKKIHSLMPNPSEVKIGLEATGHYSYNILGFLLGKGVHPIVINPLHTKLYRKSHSLRKTKTDTVDSKTITEMLMADLNLKPYSKITYFNEELKSLTRYRFGKIREKAKLKQSVTRLICILFPEIESLVSVLHLPSVYALFESYPNANYIAEVKLNDISKILSENSKGQYGEETALLIQNAAKESIGSPMPMKAMELKHTIRLIREFDFEIKEIEKEVTYQSGQMKNAYSHMEKRGSKYLRYALFNATKYVCNWEPTFSEYLSKKREEGKAYNVAISHAAKKLVRVIYHLEKTGENYCQKR